MLVIEGVLRDGLRVAAQFTELPWVREQFERKLGLNVWPGTVNLQVQDPAGLAALVRLRTAPASVGGVPIEPPPAPDESKPRAAGTSPLGGHAKHCVGWCFPARIGPLSAAVVVPQVPDYPADKLELVAAVRVRDALGLQPGDLVAITVLEAAPYPPASVAPHEGDGGIRSGPLRSAPGEASNP